MRQGKFIEHLQRELNAVDERQIVDEPHKAFVALANKVAAQHPLQYERFYWSSKIVKGWRKVMGDARNVLKFLSEEQKRKRFNRAVEVLLSIVLVLVSAGLLWLALWIKTL